MQGYVLRERLQDILISKTSHRCYIGVEVKVITISPKWTQYKKELFVEVTIILYSQKGSIH